MSPRRLLLALVSLLATTGCSTSREPLQANSRRAVVGVPFHVSFQRGTKECLLPVSVGEAPAPADAYLVPRGSGVSNCRTSRERLTFLSASCSASDCTVAEVPRTSEFIYDPDEVRVLASSTGTHVVHIEARGEESGEVLQADATIEVLPVDAVEVGITADFGRREKALAAGGSARVSAEVTVRGETGYAAQIAMPPDVLSFRAAGATIETETANGTTTTFLTNALAGGVDVTASFGPGLEKTLHLDTLEASAAVRAHLWIDEREAVEDRVVVFANGGSFVTTALEDASGVVFAGGAPTLSIEGPGCALETVPRSPHLEPEPHLSVRVIVVPAGATCTLVYGAASRRITITG